MRHDDVPAVAMGLRDLEFRYRRGTDELFGGLSHDFDTRTVTVLTGPSGRGKSTLLAILGLLLSPTAGTLTLLGEDVSAASDRARSRLRAATIGFVFQDSELDPTRRVIDSVVEPGLYAGADRGVLQQRALALLDRFGLAERAHHSPGEVSGGQAQRLALCRALVNQPAVVLADEPTGNLDPDNATLVLDALVDMAHDEGACVVIATHDPVVIARADGQLGL